MGAVCPGREAHENGAALTARFARVRHFTESLCEPLATEDYLIQSMPEVSPTKWHLAHTTWFFEQFVLADGPDDYTPFHPRFAYLFNSYYNTVGVQHCRSKRGLLSRPTVEEVYAYRRHVDGKIVDRVECADRDEWRRVAPILEIGLHHEQQHQELMLTDLKHVFASNPLLPVYRNARNPRSPQTPGIRRPGAHAPAVHWCGFEAGVNRMGHEDGGFAYDNEMPRHRVFLESYEIASRLVNCGEYLAFMEDGGYERPEHWLSAGWDAVLSGHWNAPLYWDRRDDQWMIMTLSGLRPIDPAEPVCHVSLYEADAFARWSGESLPTEAEWERAADRVPVDGHFVDEGLYHPRPPGPVAAAEGIGQLFGDVWEWTASQYRPYPGYRSPSGALGEYNGKFMSNQFVLRGGSCATSRTHIRTTYRNFFPPEARWQFTGVRLARST